MNLSAAALKLMAAKGLSLEDVADIVAANETSSEGRSPAAIRQARYRQRKAEDVTSDVTCDVTGDVTPPPIENIIPPSSEANASGGEPPADPMKELFDLGVSILTATGKTEKEARSLIGKWRKDTKDDSKVLVGLVDCRTKAISDPVEWLQKRFAGVKWVSPTGYEYRGSDREVMREAEKRNDMTTYWAVKAAADKPVEHRERPPPRNRGQKSIGQLAAEIARSASQ